MPLYFNRATWERTFGGGGGGGGEVLVSDGFGGIKISYINE
jgi:hypothetical protein